MTRADLIQRIAQKHKQLPIGDVETAVKVILESMTTALAEGQRVEVRGFGSFSLHYLSAGKRRNPATGERIEMTGRYVPHFKPGKELRNRVNNNH